LIHAANGVFNALVFALGNAVFKDINELEFDLPFLKIPFGLFRVEALRLAEDLDVHLFDPFILPFGLAREEDADRLTGALVNAAETERTVLSVYRTYPCA